MSKFRHRELQLHSRIFSAHDLRNRRERKFMFFEKRTSDTDKLNLQHRVEDKG